METSWTPIVDGDLSAVPRDEYIIFTVLDNATGELYTATGKVDEFLLQTYGYVFANRPVKCKALKAWTNLPEPYEPGGCDMCKHRKQWTGEFGDSLTGCELWPEYKPEDCPLNKEV